MKASATTSEGVPGVSIPWLPVAGWLRRYRREWLLKDAVAGFTLAAYLLPAALGDASLANLPPESGLYSCLFAGLVFWLFCSSRHTVVSVTSAISILLGSSLAELAQGDSARFGALAAGTALMVAGIAFLAWLIQAGTVVHFISESVLIGFKCGVALFLASTQLPKLLGFSSAHGDFWENSWHFLTHLPDLNRDAAFLGCAALAVLVLGKLFLKHKPVALVVVIGGIVVSSALDLGGRGVRLLGSVPEGIPMPGLPSLRWSDMNTLLPLAFACFLLGAVETSAIGRTFAAKHGGRFEASQEFLALAVANLAAALGRGFPVSGGMSQSLVNEGGGAKSPLSGAMASAILLTVALFFTRLLQHLPQPVLAAIVLVAVAGLFRLSALKELLRVDRREFVVAMVALVGVLGSGLLRGVLIGVIISIFQLIRQASRPHVALLGRIPGTQRFSDRDRHLDNELIPGVMIFRPETGLVYFNVEHVLDRIQERMDAESQPPKLVVLDLSATPMVDLQSAQALADLGRRLRSKGTRVHVVEARSGVRDRLRSVCQSADLGSLNRLDSVPDVVSEFLQESRPRL